jgi:PAS domain S-box-containing protein
MQSAGVYANPYRYHSQSHIFQKPDGRFINCNKAFEMYVGSSREDIINRDIAILSPYLEPFDLDKMEAGAGSIDDPRPVHHEYSFRQPDGATMDFMINRAPFFDMAGNFAGIVGVLTNISKKEKCNVNCKLSFTSNSF